MYIIHENNYMNITKFLSPCRVVILSHHISTNILKGLTVKSKQTFYIPTISSARTMAQRSITSFFKVSPPESKVKVEKIDITKTEERIELNGKNSAVNGDEEPTKSCKRQRLDSSDSDSGSLSTITQKKQTKRQRIVSSSSDSQSPKKSNQNQNKINENGESKVSPKIENGETVIKFEKNDKPRTYESPKSKKSKKAVNHNTSGNESPKQRKSPRTKSSPLKIKREVSQEKDEEVKSPFIKKESVKVKQENHEKDGEISVKVPETEYNPAKAKYHPINDACWAKGEEVPYLALAKTLEAIEATSARLKIVEILSNYFRSVIALTPEDLLPSVYMCLNQLAPAYHSLELGIAETYLMKAIGQCTGRTLAQVKSAAQKCGDLGLVAEQARATQRTMFAVPPLRARRVFAALQDVARMSGQASVNKKINKIQSLYVACRHSEARYLMRSLEGKLRIGLAEQSVLQALATATAMTPPDPDGVKILDASNGMPPEKFKAIVEEHALIIKTTYCECPNYEQIIPVVLRWGARALPAHCRLAPGVPLKPMLAHPTKGVHEVFDRFENEQFTCEWKYDGERAQIHVPGAAAPDLARAAVFSRNQENNTSKYPDILRRLPSLLKEDVVSCVLDCEAVAYDTINKQILPFQVLSTRKRKDASEADIKVQVCVFVFDLLYLNGRSLVREPLATRRDLLRNHFSEVEGEWQFATSKDCSSIEEVQQFLEEAVRGSCEGLMVKTLRGERARYDIARRSRNWLKLKKDYLDGVGDTIDVVVIGGYLGRGKRTGVYGGFLLACYEPGTEEYQSLCKIGTGFSDEDLQTLSQALAEHVIEAPRNYYRYDSAHAADTWFAAARVWEVRCADLSLSPAHRAAIGLVDPDKGISLRFPRFIRVRDDKSPEQATSAQQIADMYLSQDQVKNQTSKPSVNHDDFY